MYELLMFLATTQMVLGVVFVLVGAAIVVVNRFVGEHENHVTKLADAWRLSGSGS